MALRVPWLTGEWVQAFQVVPEHWWHWVNWVSPGWGSGKLSHEPHWGAQRERILLCPVALLKSPSC